MIKERLCVIAQHDSIGGPPTRRYNPSRVSRPLSAGRILTYRFVCPGQMLVPRASTLWGCHIPDRLSKRLPHGAETLVSCTQEMMLCTFT